MKTIQKACTVDTVTVYTEFTYFDLYNRRRRNHYQAVLVPFDRLYIEETGVYRSRYQAIKAAKKLIRRYYLPNSKEYSKGLDQNPINIEA